jgi:hypothetical protein
MRATEHLHRIFSGVQNIIIKTLLFFPLQTSCRVTKGKRKCNAGHRDMVSKQVSLANFSVWDGICTRGEM